MNMPTTPDVIFKSYMPDGPGWCGDMHFKFGSVLRQTLIARDGAKSIIDLDCPIEIPAVASVGPVESLAAKQAVFARLPESYQEWLSQDAANLEHARVQALVFEDGSQGAIALGGECCYLVVVHGHHSIEFAYDKLHHLETFQTAFELPVQAPRERQGN